MTDTKKGNTEKGQVSDTGKRSKFAATDIIRVVVTCNPKVKASRKRFACYTDKGTVADYTAACQALPAGSGNKYGRADLAWDTERGMVAVYPKGHKMALAPIADVRATVKCHPRYNVDPTA